MTDDEESVSLRQTRNLAFETWATLLRRRKVVAVVLVLEILLLQLRLFVVDNYGVVETDFPWQGEGRETLTMERYSTQRRRKPPVAADRMVVAGNVEDDDCYCSRCCCDCIDGDCRFGVLLHGEDCGADDWKIRTKQNTWLHHDFSMWKVVQETKDCHCCCAMEVVAVNVGDDNDAAAA